MTDDAIRGKRLTHWEPSQDGTAVELGFIDDSGHVRAILLPVELLSALMMTIPRMLSAALDRQFGDGSLRVVHELGQWRLEQAANGDFILSLATPCGFEVRFAVPTPQVGQLAAALDRSANGAGEDMLLN